MSGDLNVGGVTIHQLALSPGLALDFAVSNGLVMISTSAGAIGQVVGRAERLAKNPSYRAVLGSGPQSVSSLLFLDFNQLLALVEEAGLGQSQRLIALRPDLARIAAVGLQTTRGESDTTAELSLKIP